MAPEILAVERAELAPASADQLSIRPMRPSDVEEAERIFRLAFGTLFRLSDPSQFGGDASLVRSRFAAFPERAFVAERAGELLGSNFASRWGSVAVIGPLSTRPDVWDRGVGTRLFASVMEYIGGWGTRLAGLYTLASSPKHIALYQKFGFWPRMLTAVMARPVDRADAPGGLARYRALDVHDRERCIAECARLTDEIYPGLDLTDEIRAVHRLGFGDTVLLRGDTGIEAFAVCHWGAGSEGGSNTCHVKFGAARPGTGVKARFQRLLAACNKVALMESLTTLRIGVNAGRERAWREVTAAGFRTVAQGVAMHRNNAEGYSRPDVFVLDDWR